MGAGSAITGWTLVFGLLLIIGGIMVSMTIIGLLIGIPMIIIGLKLIAGGAIVGGAVGAGNIISKGVKEHRNARIEEEELRQKRLKFKAEMHQKGYCNNCGSRLKRGTKFCSECGAKVGYSNEENVDETAEPTQKYCPNCGKLVKEKAKFCSKCGTRL